MRDGHGRVCRVSKMWGDGKGTGSGVVVEGRCTGIHFQMYVCVSFLLLSTCSWQRMIYDLFFIVHFTLPTPFMSHHHFGMFINALYFLSCSGYVDFFVVVYVMLISLFVCFCLYLSSCMFACLPVCLSVFLCMNICMYVCIYAWTHLRM